MLWMIYCIEKPNMAAVRKAVNADHSKNLKDREKVIFFSGRLPTDDGEGNLGSVFIINAADRAEAQAFSDSDAYTQAGVFESVRITRVKKGKFKPEILDQLKD